MAAINPEDLQINNIIFQIKDHKSANCKKISIKYKHDDEKITDLCIILGPITSYGIKEGKNSENINYSLPLVIDDPKSNDIIEKITTKCKEFLKTQKLEKKLQNSIDSLDMLYHSPNNPILYPRLLTKFQTSEIDTDFYEINSGEEVSIDPKELIGQPIKIFTTLLINEIYIGNKISIN